MHSGAEASSSRSVKNETDSPVSSGSQGQQVGSSDRQSASGDVDSNAVDEINTGANIAFRICSGCMVQGPPPVPKRASDTMDDAIVA